jgi:hypothetical protein
MFFATAVATEPFLLWLKNGTVLEAKLQSFGQETAWFQTNAFEENDVEVFTSAINAVHLPDQNGNVKYRQIKLHFSGGGTLSGAANKTSSGWVAFRSFWGQKIKVNRLLKKRVLIT